MLGRLLVAALLATAVVCRSGAYHLSDGLDLAVDELEKNLGVLLDAEESPIKTTLGLSGAARPNANRKTVANFDTPTPQTPTPQTPTYELLDLAAVVEELPENEASSEYPAYLLVEKDGFKYSINDVVENCEIPECCYSYTPKDGVTARITLRDILVRVEEQNCWKDDCMHHDNPILKSHAKILDRKVYPLEYMPMKCDVDGRTKIINLDAIRKLLEPNDKPPTPYLLEAMAKGDTACPYKHTGQAADLMSDRKHVSMTKKTLAYKEQPQKIKDKIESKQGIIYVKGSDNAFPYILGLFPKPFDTHEECSLEKPCLFLELRLQEKRCSSEQDDDAEVEEKC